MEGNVRIVKLKSGNFIICKKDNEMLRDLFILGFTQQGVGFASLGQPFSDKPVDIPIKSLEDQILLDITPYIEENELVKNIITEYESNVSQLKTGLITNVSGIKLK